MTRVADTFGYEGPTGSSRHGDGRDRDLDLR